MTYRAPALSKTPLLIIAALLALGHVPAKAASTPSEISLRFATEGSILPRRSHMAIDLESINIERLDISIQHVPEADTLAALQHPDAAVPAEATESWHGQIAAGSDGKLPVLDQPTTTTVDILQLVKQLQAGAYIIDAHEATTGKPRAQVRKFLLISNIGLEALSGADGIAVQARLLSEASPAQAIDVALIAKNNREIARIRTDGDGVARFTREQSNASGDDSPAAVYAYGADGEFTALLLPGRDNSVGSRPQAWIITDKQSYKPGENIRGLALVRTTSGLAPAEGTIYAQLETAAGDVAEVQKLETTGELRLHAPAQGQNWVIRVYRDLAGKAVLVGSAPISLGYTAVSSDRQASPPQSRIVISPGRRSFQRGEMASISIQPDFDADVTVALVDGSVRAIERQHIGKEGGYIQLPVPNDATAGLYVLATAFTIPAPGKPVIRSFGLQWIGVDEGGAAWVFASILRKKPMPAASCRSA